MRPVDKGVAPQEYTDYGQARHDLAERIGYYCSYCEMRVLNSIEVEHILPQNQEGEVLSWSNFLLSCKYCNTIKSDHNKNTSDYFWPDRDNTDLVFEYEENAVISPKPDLTTPQLTDKANATIALMGLNRKPGEPIPPTEADTRWRSRKEAWDEARKSLNNWKQAQCQPMAIQIAICSRASGHYSIWRKVFETEKMVLDEIDNTYKTKGLFKQYNPDGTRVVRPSGLI
jgi:uncharacterized protein (TIGR02646 family)